MEKHHNSHEQISTGLGSTNDQYHKHRSYEKYVIHQRVVDKREAVLNEFPDIMLPQIRDYLVYAGIDKLFSHQKEMFDAAMEGKNVVITTATASGKTLAFLLPVLQDIIKNPSTRAIFIYPTKALASDQCRAMVPLVEFFGRDKISIGVYDGDTSVNERSRIRNSANIILTNPEMMNSAFLPHHSQYGLSFVFSNLKYIIIDELHSYRGAFGSHLANIFRRLSRICKYYSSSPRFLCSSATLANPVELAENICGDLFYHVSNDGSPAPKKQYYFIQPPDVKGAGKMPAPDLSAEMIPEFIMQKRSFIAFCRARKTVEVVLKESRDKLKYDGIAGQDYSDLISGYRGGYTPQERKAIESKMISGKIQGLISTNALELGIDIGKGDTTMLIGYPGTRSSFWQQSGRAGRSGKPCDTFLILDSLPFDQYLAIDPNWLFEATSEYALVDKNNLYIQIAHVRSAAAELPLTLDDVALFPDLGEIIPVLIRANELKNESGRFIWCGKAFPAGDYSLRNMEIERYKLINSENSAYITEMDETPAFLEIHDGSIYMHEGQSYLVTKLDLNSKTALAKPTDENYYTYPFCDITLSEIKRHKEKKFGRTNVYFGDINVKSVVLGHKRIQFHNHQNLGFDKIDPPLTMAFDTEGVWINIPQNVVDLYIKLIPFKNENQNFWKNYYGGLCFTILNAARMITMTTKDDINAGHLQYIENDTQYSAICVYDLFIGGLGYSEKAYDVIEQIINNAMKMVSGCKCKDGCPACVGDYSLDKNIVLWGLRNLYDEIADPVDLKVPLVPIQTAYEKQFSFDTISDKWNEFAAYIHKKGEYLSSFIATIAKVRTEASKLILIVENDFYKSWLLDADNKKKLINMLSHYIYVPNNFDIDVFLKNMEYEDKRDKTVRRYSGLTKSRTDDK